MNGFGEIMRLMGKSYRDALGLVSNAGPTLFTALFILAVGDVAGILAMRLFASELGKTLIGALLRRQPSMMLAWFNSSEMITSSFVSTAATVPAFAAKPL